MFKKIIKKLLGIKPRYGFFGFYPSWDEAKKYTTRHFGGQAGWNADNVLKQVSQSLLKVKNGQAVYERDSVLFDKIQYSWPLLAILERVAMERGGDLKVLDFGGSLGTTYFQNRDFLSGLKSLDWRIVEQENYVEEGIKNFQNEELKFFSDFDHALQSSKPDILIVSSVIQYLPRPFEMIEKFLAVGFDYIIFDRTSFIELPDHKIAIQKVKPSIYDAVLPIWFFNYEKFMNQFSGKYNIIGEYKAFIADRYEISGIPGGDRGFILKRKP